MVHHYKMGNISEAKRIQHMLDGNKKEVNIKIDDDDPDVFEWYFFNLTLFLLHKNPKLRNITLSIF